MPAPTGATFSVDAKVAAHTAFRDLIDSHATLPGSLRFRSAADVLLSEVVLPKPCGTVNPITGQLVFDVDPIPRDDETNADGIAAYGEFCDGAGAVHLALPCEEGTDPVSGKIVMLTLTVVAGGPLELQSATVG